MLLEIATIEIRPGAEDDFAAAMRGGGLAHLAACTGVRKLRFGRGVEHPSNFTFLVEWDSIEAHNAARSEDSFDKFRAAFGDMAIGGSMEHFQLDPPA